MEEGVIRIQTSYARPDVEIVAGRVVHAPPAFSYLNGLSVTSLRAVANRCRWQLEENPPKEN